MSDHVASCTLPAVYLQAAPAADQQPPLTSFMLHVWAQRGMSPDAWKKSQEREQFVYWFYDTYHATRAPYTIVSAPELLQWLNTVGLDLSDRFGQKGCYLTRYMLHVREQHRREADIGQFEGYLRFLSWFALEYIPARNLPAALLPDDLLPSLNKPMRPPLPITAAMAARANLRENATDEAAVAASYEILPDFAAAGDARLIPDFVSQFWSRKLSAADPASLSAYEYFSARAFRPELDIGDARDWLARRCRIAVPGAALFSAPLADAAAPSGAALNSADKLVVVYRDHQTIAGLSKAGLQTKEALARSGFDVVDLDFSFGRDRMAEEARHNFARRRWARSSLHIFNLNPEYVPDCVMCHLSSLDESAYRIGQFYWELSDTSSIHDCGLSLMDEIWVATEYLRDVYRRRVSVPIHVMGQAIEPPPPESRFDRASFQLPQSAYMFLFSFDAGSVVERKNPLAIVQAFRQAFPSGTEHAALVLKTRKLDSMQTDRDRDHWRRVTETSAGDKRIFILDRTFTEPELVGLMSVADCYVSLHRSEGFGYGPADALALGKPVITTGYSGVTDFCTPETALLVDYKLERVPAGAYPYMDDAREYHWASPEVGVAAAHMRRLYETPGVGEKLGKAGRQWIREHYSLAALRRRYVTRLAELGWT